MEFREVPRVARRRSRGPFPPADRAGGRRGHRGYRGRPPSLRTLPTTIPVTGPDDPRVAGYRHLRDAEVRRSLEGPDGVFVVEGALAVRALLSSPWAVHSVFLSEPKADALRDVTAKAASKSVPVYTAPLDMMAEIAGFPFHRGVLALGRRRPDPDRAALLRGTRAVAVVEGVNDHENLGALFRNAAAFGIGAVLCDPTCADPLYRRSIRVSVGHVLSVPFARLTPWPASLDDVRRAGFILVALTPIGEESLDDLASGPALGPVATLLGAEGPGLSDAALAAADRRVRIPLANGVDSLNVATAAAVAWHRLAHL